MSLLTQSLLEDTNEELWAPPPPRRTPRPSISSFTTDGSSDDDWDSIQRDYANSKRIAKEADAGAADTLKDCDKADNLVRIEELRAEVEEKEERLRALQERMESARERFIWDLALALKRMKFEEYGACSEMARRISNVSIQSILRMAREEAPEPHEWMAWIASKYPISA